MQGVVIRGQAIQFPESLNIQIGLHRLCSRRVGYGVQIVEFGQLLEPRLFHAAAGSKAVEYHLAQFKVVPRTIPASVLGVGVIIAIFPSGPPLCIDLWEILATGNVLRFKRRSKILKAGADLGTLQYGSLDDL